MTSNTAVRQDDEQIEIEREMLLDRRDQLAGMVRGHKRELQVSLERWCNEGRGSVKAIWQTIGAIRQGENQIAVIDVQLEGVSIS